MSQPEPPYALYHVHRHTGEKQRYPRASFPATRRQEAENAASWARRADAVAGTADEWRTEAHPDEPTPELPAEEGQRILPDG